MKTIGTLGMIAKGMSSGALHRARLEEPVAKNSRAARRKQEREERKARKKAGKKRGWKT